MGFWNIVLAVVIGAMLYRIGVNIATAIADEVKWNKSFKESFKESSNVTDITCVTLSIPYANFNEEKIDVNQLKRLELNHETNKYVAVLNPMIGRLTVSEVKKIADEYSATSYSIEYIA